MSIEYNAAILILHTHSLWANVRILLAMNPLVSLLVAGVYRSAWFYVLISLTLPCRYPDQKQLRKERMYFRLHSIIVGKLRQQCQKLIMQSRTERNECMQT